MHSKCDAVAAIRLRFAAQLRRLLGFTMAKIRIGLYSEDNLDSIKMNNENRHRERCEPAEIEVTPEMIEAGQRALVNACGYFETDVPFRNVIEAVLRAALRAQTIQCSSQ